MKKKELTTYLSSFNNYVIYRLPGSSFINIVTSTSIVELNSISQLRKISEGFVFAPFSTNHHPIIVFSSPTVKSIEITTKISSKTCLQYFPSPITEEYASSFHLFHQEIEKGSFKKIVLARCQTLESNVSPLQLFWEACEAFPNAMVYLLQSSSSGTWLGATPELLIEGNESQMHTISLAGTMIQENGKEICLSDWSEKNKTEQEIVTDFIRTRIRSIGNLTDEWGPYCHKISHLVHLKTDLYFRVSAEKIPELLQALHPTPAVCGIPQQESILFIQKNEPIDRSYYTGFLGWYDPKNISHIYVNLRCINWIDSNLIRLFAGGGILASSQLASEWQETEQKLFMIRSLPSF